jgi:hypothetical protein
VCHFIVSKRLVVGRRKKKANVAEKIRVAEGSSSLEREEEEEEKEKKKKKKDNSFVK